MATVRFESLLVWHPTRIARWHYNTFKMVLVSDQYRKLELELREAKKAKRYEDIIEEWADVWIVACSLYHRFHQLTGKLVMDYIRSQPEYMEIMYAVDAKMEINVKRTWHITIDGETRHDD